MDFAHALRAKPRVRVVYALTRVRMVRSAQNFRTFMPPIDFEFGPIKNGRTAAILDFRKSSTFRFFIVLLAVIMQYFYLKLNLILFLLRINFKEVNVYLNKK